ncbi:MAG TPA: hypothetical protein PK737_02180 [Bacilli bacterium]|nr:hypothetical protein [Bacilli bacterium]
MKDLIYYNNLFDHYEFLLTTTERAIFTDYYRNNLSLREIAENRAISHSAVQKTIKLVIKKMTTWETELNQELKDQMLRKCLTMNDITKIKKEIIKILTK